MEYKAKIKELKNKIKQIKETLAEEATKILVEETIPFFEKAPSLKSVAWSQYTDYYNDGEECKFRVSVDYFEVNMDGKEFTLEDKYSWNDDIFVYDETNEEHKTLSDLTDFIYNIVKELGNNTCKSVFGDHKQLILSKGKLTIEDYTSHD